MKTRKFAGRAAWTEIDDAILMRHHESGMAYAEIASVMGRSRASVACRIKCLGIAKSDEDEGWVPNECQIRVMAWALRLKRDDDWKASSKHAPVSLMKMREDRPTMYRRSTSTREQVGLPRGGY